MVYQALTSKEILKNCYALTQEYPKKKVITFRSKALTLLEHDNQNKTTINLAYESASLFKIKDKTWAVAFGETTTPTTDYINSDIIALELEEDELAFNHNKDEELEDSLSELIIRSSELKNSLICSLENGRFAAPINSRFGSTLLDLLKPRFQQFIVQGSDKEQVRLYKPQLAREMTSWLFNVLNSYT